MSIYDVNKTFEVSEERHNILNKLSMLGRLNDYNCNDEYTQLDKYMGKAVNIKLPDLFNTIKMYAFSKNYDITELITNEHLIDIEKYAFRECKKLSKVTFNKGLKIIDLEAFSECKELTKVKLNGGLKIIDIEAFKKCNLTEVVLPSTLIYLGVRAFDENPLTDVYVESNKINFEMLKGSCNTALWEFEELAVHFKRSRREEIMEQYNEILNRPGRFKATGIEDRATTRDINNFKLIFDL